MTRRLVLLRHGRTPWNHEGRVQGHRDVGLDDVGHAQAAAVAPVVAKLSPAQLWCSDLERARQTVAPVAVACGLEPRYDERLREFGFGDLEGRTHTELAADAPDDFTALRRGDYHRISTAEPLAQVRARMASALGELLGLLEADQTGVALSHGAAIRVAVGELLGWPAEQFGTLGGLPNCTWAELAENPVTGRLQLVALGRGA
ncbi:histidine phosphatase family protein [Nocardioides nanhaiensis]|uniref:Histidine phosphatase family protein n=1 Tax=Nocardioides nanhaiensis TaxID=1476871 RepID=A0ABP8WQJ6_9ACTN